MVNDNMTPMEAWNVIRGNLYNLYKRRKTTNFKGYTDEDQQAELICFQALKEMEEKKGCHVVLLPCVPGTTVYEIRNNTDACYECQNYSAFYGMDETCDLNGKLRNCPEVADTPLCDKQFLEIVEWQPNEEEIFRHRNQFGKTFFLDRKKAEQVLEKTRKGPACANCENTVWVSEGNGDKRCLICGKTMQRRM